MSSSPDKHPTAMDVQDPITRQIGSTTANLQDLLIRSDGTDSHSNGDLDVSHLNTTAKTMSDRRLTKPQADTTHPFAQMSTEEKEFRCLEIEKQEAKLQQELPTHLSQSVSLIIATGISQTPISQTPLV
jgi:hypothetical protein